MCTTIVRISVWTAVIIGMLSQTISAQRRNGQGDDKSQRVTEILDSLLQGYDKRVRPNYGNDPVVVGVTMYILNILYPSQDDMCFTADFYFRQTWRDPRLKFQGEIKSISPGTEFLEKLWVPDTFFVNENRNLQPNPTPEQFVRIAQDGSVLFSTRFTKTFSCRMDLRNFPMDSHQCSMELESFGFTQTDVRYEWAKGYSSVGISNEIYLPEFTVNGHKQQDQSISLSTGNYSRMSCDIVFTRMLGYYLLQMYIPAQLIVLISWVSFWLNRKSTPARVALNITSGLTTRQPDNYKERFKTCCCC